MVVADSTRTTDCVSEESIVQADVAERRLDRKRAKDIFPMQFGTQMLRPDGGQAVESCTDSADGSCHGLSDSIPEPFTHSESASPRNEAASKVAENAVMTAPTSLTRFTNQKAPQNGGVLTAPKSEREIADHGSTRQDSDPMSTVLEITTKEHSHEEIGNGNSELYAKCCCWQCLCCDLIAYRPGPASHGQRS